MSGKVKFKEPNIINNLIDEYFNENDEKRDYFWNNGNYVQKHFLKSELTSNYWYFSEKYKSKPDSENDNNVYTAYRINFGGYDILVEDTSHEQEETFNMPNELFVIEE